MKNKKYLIGLLIVILIGIYSVWNVFGPAVKVPEGKYFYIKTGSTYSQVKDSLVSKGIIPNGLFFGLLSSLSKYPSKVWPGKYEIKKGMSVLELLRKLKSGKQDGVRLVINKIRTRYDFAGKIEKSFETDSTTVLKFISSNDSLAKFELDTNTLFTAIIPNTYLFYWNKPISSIIKTLQNQQKIFWNIKRSEKLKKINLTEGEVYIIASLVEEETNKPEDKGLIASVYLNRLAKDMKLDADPTIRFAHQDFTIKRVLHGHLDIESPYNTYKNKGLPPGPICTPSIATIDSVLNAPATNYLFFVAKPDFKGYSVFSATYSEHLRNAEKYRKALDSLLSTQKNNH